MLPLITQNGGTMPWAHLPGDPKKLKGWARIVETIRMAIWKRL